MTAAVSDTVLSVKDLNQMVKDLLDDALGQIWLMGEISNFSKPVSGHWYFTLKDESAQVCCAMFRGSNYRMGFLPENGQQVLVQATVTLYEARGEYQLVVDKIQPAGVGLLQKQFEKLKMRLQEEGLFEVQHKQPLPDLIRRVGIITSSTGAALYDICQILKRRDPSLHIIIYPALVQGKEAASHIVRMIATANHRNECDILIVGRGGGSLEDLWPFNEESVARAIFASHIPIISAVGHEIDFTIADFVADIRAATPSAAAELVSKNKEEQINRLRSAEQRLFIAMDYAMLRQRERFSAMAHRLSERHPELQLSRQRSQLEQYQSRLIELVLHRSHTAQQHYQYAAHRLIQLSPDKTLAEHQLIVIQWQERLIFMMSHLLHSIQHQFMLSAEKLDNLSPLKTLSRGYSITLNEQNEVITSAEKLTVGQTLLTQFSEGKIKSQITEIYPFHQRK